MSGDLPVRTTWTGDGLLREFAARGQAAQEKRARSHVLNLVTSELLSFCHYEGVSLDAAGRVAEQIVDSLFRNFRLSPRSHP